MTNKVRNENKLKINSGENDSGKRGMYTGMIEPINQPTSIAAKVCRKDFPSALFFCPPLLSLRKKTHAAKAHAS